MTGGGLALPFINVQFVALVTEDAVSCGMVTCYVSSFLAVTSSDGEKNEEFFNLILRIRKTSSWVNTPPCVFPVFQVPSVIHSNFFAQKLPRGARGPDEAAWWQIGPQ